MPEAVLSVTRIIFERGIEVGPTKNSVQLPATGNTLAQIYAAIWEKHKVRPVLLTELVPQIGGGSPQDRHLVLTLDGREILDVLASSLQLPTPSSFCRHRVAPASSSSTR
jgi:hypothetical protein